MMKKIIYVILVLILFLPTSILADNENVFDENESYYISHCAGSNLSEEDKVVCKEFRDYLRINNEELENELDELILASDDINKNVETYAEEYGLLKEKLIEIDAEIERLEAMIAVEKEGVDEVNVEIEKVVEDLEDLERVIDYKLMNDQRNINGTKNVLNLGSIELQKISGELYDEDHDSIIKFNQILELLDIEREFVSQDFLALTENQTLLEKAKRDVISMNSEMQVIFVAYKKQQADIEAKLTEKVDEYEAVIDIMKKISNAISDIQSSSEWLNPISGDYDITATAWRYPESFGGGVHLGLDIAAPEGREVLAPANGVVLHSVNSCSNDGYLGNSCGKPGSIGGGNQVTLLVKVDEVVYAVNMLHMMGDTVSHIGTIVEQGDIVGKMSSSGNSTGTHTHIEVIKLGDIDINEFVGEWDGDLSMGTGYGTAALETICDNKKSTPCRVAPQTIFKKAN